jgi:hypothetical protein
LTLPAALEEQAEFEVGTYHITPYSVKAYRVLLLCQAAVCGVYTQVRGVWGLKALLYLPTAGAFTGVHTGCKGAKNALTLVD